MLIVFEGVDGCGKTTLSKELSKTLNWHWEKEPMFSSEKSDSLNLNSKNDIEREIEFCIDRIKHQEIIKKLDNIVCDRYIWCGLSYCLNYNPDSFPFAKIMYQHDFFIKPDYYIFVETPIQVCFDRKKIQTRNDLNNIKQCYYKTKNMVSDTSKIITVNGYGDIDKTINYIISEIGENGEQKTIK